ncbi:hypothetical protein ABZ532_08020 [Streptomyces sp. NPDC019396]|uniref:hypothetical protein n=1 Tax=Streptomyces sp. NPDC019396 TaxID=3154687 RepID=UPI0033FEC84C
MTTSETSRYVRLHVELVLEVAEPEALASAATERIEADEYMHDDERTHARSAVLEDSAEALAYLVDPFDLLSDVPGVDLAQASWSCEQVDYDPDAEGEEWDLDDEGDEEAEGAEGAGGHEHA